MSLPPHLIDLSRTLEENASERVPVRLDYLSHLEGARDMAKIFGVQPSELPDGLGWSSETLCAVTHSGTHMDAPWHYGPISEGRPARTIDEVPLDWCVGPGVKLDLREMPEGAEVAVADLERALDAAGHRLRPGEIVLLETGAGAYWGRSDYPDRGCGLGREATLWLAGQSIKVVGTDAWGLDRPFCAMPRDLDEQGRASALWPSHFAGREREYCQLEKLTNLDLLPPRGFQLFCFPIKIARASAAWVRVVAAVS